MIERLKNNFYIGNMSVRLNKKRKLNMLSSLNNLETGMKKHKNENVYNVYYGNMLSNILELNHNIRLYKYSIQKDNKIMIERFKTHRYNDYDYPNAQVVYIDSQNNEHLYTFSQVFHNINNKKRITIDDRNLNKLYVNENKTKLYYFNIEKDNIKRYLMIQGIRIIKDNNDLIEFAKRLDMEAEEKESRYSSRSNISNSRSNNNSHIEERYGSGKKYINYLKKQSTSKNTTKCKREKQRKIS